MRRVPLLSIALLLSLLGGCRRDPNAGAAPLSQSPPSAPSTVIAATPPPPKSEPCGELGCLAFDTPLAAFEFVMSHAPQVLAVGEAHAQKGTESVKSSTKRFSEDLLPTLAGKTRGLVLELWLGEPKCGKVVEVVREQQKPVTATQAKTNPNEMVALGDRAYGLGIRPFPLKPSCEDYAPIADAGADAVPLMLELIARLSRDRILALLRDPDAGAGLVLAYGGALHNDVAPSKGKERYTFGPDLAKALGDGYVELDLIVGDYVRADEPWASLPWTKPYLSQPRTAKTIVYRPQPRSFVLVFPKTL